MCGFAGIFDTRDRSPQNRDILERMNQVIFHRGPDAGGYHEEPGLGLAHRRLSIIDLSGGSQPLYNEDKSVVVVYNGEIYNFQELIDELVSLGHVFHTRCDTEVIVHGWEQWGERCVDRFRGMFAFALWDRNTETLFLSRDRLGVKPLYYAPLPDGSLLFGSELKALLCHPGLMRVLDPRAIEDYFAYGYVPEPRTILTQALKLPPAHTLTVRRGKPIPEPRAFWDVSFSPNGIRSVEDAGQELIARLREAVRIRLIAEVPLGAFLSGGVDSSAVVALMAGLSPEPVNTCTMAFGERAFDESDFAEEIARRYGTHHQVETVNPDSFELVGRLGDLYDEPFADSSAIPTYRVCELARKRVIVALSGDGGDENLAGYRRYRWHVYEDRIRSALPRAVRRPMFGLLGALYPKADWAPRVLRAKATLQGIARDSVEAYFHSVSLMGDTQRRQLYRDSFRAELQGYNAIEVLRGHARRGPASDPLSMVQYLDLKTYLPGDILTKVDRASMAHSLEVRVPLLDHLLVEWLAGLPPGMKLHGHESKYVFKRALEPYLTKDQLYRPKMGFAVPLATWFRGPLRQRVRDAVLGDAMRELAYFDLGYMERMVDQHQAGVRDHSASLWALMMFESSLQRMFGMRTQAGDPVGI
jgi:asparagine synthase (glutamine-hydrolysing)